MSKIINFTNSFLISDIQYQRYFLKLPSITFISNFLNNAYKFTENGQIIVKIKKKIDYEKKQVKIIVKDTGTGIDKEILPRLFEKFATKSEAGTGLGLYISKKIVEAHGGKIWAENNSSDDR